MRRLGIVLVFFGLALVACAGPPQGEAAPAATGDTSTEAPSEWSGNTRNVPGDYPTIQAAVDAAEPGDLVLIDEGTYRESVDVRTLHGLSIAGGHPSRRSLRSPTTAGVPR